MFENFANVWTIVGLARDLKRDAPMAMRVAGERVVFFRDARGKVCALIDRCPHRGVALSFGRVTNGVIECPFHGWRFDGAGANCGVPWNPDAKRERLGATALPTREAGGLLWLHTGFSPQCGPLVPETLSTQGLALCARSVRWRAHWTRVMENMLDMPHLPFVHRMTIGRSLAPLVGGRMDVRWDGRPFGAHITNMVDGAPRAGALDYRFPNAMELFIDPPGRVLRLMAICVPEDEATTRLVLLTFRSFLKARAFDGLFYWMNSRIAREDKDIVESSLPLEAPAPGEESSVRTDEPTLAFRRIWRSQLRQSSAPTPDR